ncbi:hypothetical protein LguiA_024780 [Lonicera macranthoides]
MAPKNPHYEAKTDKQSTDNTKELILKPRNLSIVWGNDDRYWRMPDPQDPDSAAELLQVNWLEVTGFINLSRGKSYEIGFNVSLTPDAFGWSGLQVYIMAKIGKKGKYVLKKQYVIKPTTDNQRFDIPFLSDKLKIDVPTFAKEDTVYFGLYEVWSGRWKGGLRVHHAFVREI